MTELLLEADPGTESGMTEEEEDGLFAEDDETTFLLEEEGLLLLDPIAPLQDDDEALPEDDETTFLLEEEESFFPSLDPFDFADEEPLLDPIAPLQDDEGLFVEDDETVLTEDDDSSSFADVPLSPPHATNAKARRMDPTAPLQDDNLNKILILILLSFHIPNNKIQIPPQMALRQKASEPI